MSIASASYTFSPNAGGTITVTNKANETEVKAAVLAVLAQRKATAQGEVTNLESAESAMNG
jgi:hypothetical protein